MTTGPRSRHAAASLFLIAAGVPLASGTASGATTERVSLASDSAQANGISAWLGQGRSMAISADGRFVVFTSLASNLVPRDTNGVADVFRHDRLTGETIRISVSSKGHQGNRASVGGLDVSATGRFVVFASKATDLVRRDTNRSVDVFIRDVRRDVTRRVSLDYRGRQLTGDSRGPAISADSRFVAFSSTAHLALRDSRIEDVYVRKRRTGTTRRMSLSSKGVSGNAASYEPALSADGTIVAFASEATNLVRASDGNFDNPDVFVRNRSTKRTSRVSVDSQEHQLLGCSSGGSFSPSITASGSRVAFTFVGSDSCGGYVMLRRRASGTTEQVDVGLTGALPDGWSGATGISAGGRFVSFDSFADNLVSGDDNGVPFNFTGGDVFVRDVRLNTTARVSVTESGSEANKSSAGGPISSDGRYVVFASKANNLVAGDTNKKVDVFVRGPLP